ncbi:18001_t:CDS:2 [Gigaspora rosea]|nr:18001_t:CDS:2 [Gigaspora rosea]
MSNPKQELHYYGLDLTEEEIQTVFQDITFDPEIEHQDLELENFIELNNVEQDIDNESMDKSIGVNTDKHTDENTDDDEFNNEEFNEDQLGAELEELIYHSQ